MYSPVSRKVYGAVLVLMVLVSALESTKGEDTGSLTAVEVEELPHMKNSQVQAAVIGGMKTVARRSTPGRENSGIRASASMPSLVVSVVVVVVVNVAAMLS